MKTIQLPSAQPPVDANSPITEHRLYSVMLGNRTVCYFNSTRHAEQFRASAERFLNDVLFRSNLLLSEVYPAWRMAWHYLDSLKPSTERALTSSIRDAENTMDRALRRRGGPDYIHYAWKDVSVSLAHLRAVLLALVDIYRHKGHGVDRARWEVALRHCNELSDSLRLWGADYTDAPNAAMIRRSPDLQP